LLLLYLAKLSGGILAWLPVLGEADMHMAQLMPQPLTVSCSSKSRLVLPFWYWLTRVVPDTVQGGRKTVVVVVVPCKNWISKLLIRHSGTRLLACVKVKGAHFEQKLSQ